MNGGVRQRLTRRRRGAPATAFTVEFTRCFGDSRFDHVVNFSGYGPFWAELLLHSPPAVRSIWLHNDLAADAHRTVGGAKRMLRGLTETFARYDRYDSLVSVSPALAEINAEALAAYAPHSKFTVAHNTVDVARIRRGAAATEPAAEPATVVPVVAALTAADPSIAELETGAATTTFVTIGRLSPEKNQARLIRAFALVHARHPLTRLVIVGGGQLKAELAALIRDLNLGEAITLTGALANPYPVLALADCFVLSSDYEGAPMVILEALVLGRPVVTVAFASVHDALPNAAGLVVPQTDAGLAAGLTAFLRGEVVASAFNQPVYARRAVTEFYRAIGVADEASDVDAELAPVERLSQR